jgi:hypothetical protein
MKERLECLKTLKIALWHWRGEGGVVELLQCLLRMIGIRSSGGLLHSRVTIENNDVLLIS